MTERLVHGNNYSKDSLSFSCFVISAVFFAVLSQFLVLRATNITPLFRPIIVLSAFILLVQRGHLSNSITRIAFIAAIYELIVFLFELITGADMNEVVRAGSATVLYLLMCACACAVPWNGRELRVILLAVFFGCFACSIVFALSNNLADVHYSSLDMLGVEVNRNKNAYAFALGTLLGIIYLTRLQSTYKRLPVLVMTSLMGYCVLYSQCRGAFFCLVLSVFVLVIGKTMIIRKESGSIYLLYVFMFLAGCIIVYFLLKNSDMSRLVDAESKSGRDDGIETAWGMFLESGFIGKVFGNGFMYENKHSDSIGAHLVYATFLVSSGLVGAALISSLFLVCFKHIRTTIPLSLLGFAFARTFFEGLDYYIYIPLIMAVIFYHYQIFYGRSSLYGLFS